jgi:hypothetical protein
MRQRPFKGANNRLTNYDTRKFITLFTKTLDLDLSC